MRLFLAAPFTGKINCAKGEIEIGYRTWLASIADRLRQAGHEVVCAHEREAWGADLDAPEDAVSLDFQEIDASDAVVAYVGEPPSPGVQLELGYASARRKPIVLFYRRDSYPPYLTQGISAVTEVVQFSFDHEDYAGERLISVLASLSNAIVGPANDCEDRG